MSGQGRIPLASVRLATNGQSQAMEATSTGSGMPLRVNVRRPTSRKLCLAPSRLETESAMDRAEDRAAGRDATTLERSDHTVDRTAPRALPLQHPSAKDVGVFDYGLRVGYSALLGIYAIGTGDPVFMVVNFGAAVLSLAVAIVAFTMKKQHGESRGGSNEGKGQARAQPAGGR